MRRSHFLFQLIFIPAVLFLAFFFNHALSLLPTTFAFLKHVCSGWESFASIAPTIMVQTLIVLGLFSLSLLMLLSKVLNFLLTLRKIHHLREVRNFKKYPQFLSLRKRYPRTKLFYSSKPSAFCHFKTIYLSSALFHVLEEHEVEAVFLHELGHAQHMDSFKIWMIELVSKVLLFPLFHSLIRDFKLTLELEADMYVKRTQGSDRFLKGALLKVISYQDLNVAHFSACQLEQRISALKQGKEHQGKVDVKAFLGVLMFFSISIFFLHHAKMALAMSEISVHHDSNFCVNDHWKVVPMSSVQNYSSASH